MRMAALLKASFSLSWSFFPQQPVILQHLKSLSSAFTRKQNVSCSESRHQIDVHMNFGHFSWPQPRLLCLCNKHCEPALKRLFWSVPSSSRGSKQKCLQNNIKWRARARWEVLVIEDSHYYSCQVWPYNNVSPQLPNLPIKKKRRKERHQKLGRLFQSLNVRTIKHRAWNRTCLMCSPGQTGPKGDSCKATVS